MTPEMQALDNEVRRVFAKDITAGRIGVIGGVTNCRRKNNKPGNPYSEHSWSNAKDYKITPIRGEAGDRLAAWARKSPLVSQTFWKIDLHLDHVHLTANPRRNFDDQQIPPCAGGQPIGDNTMFTKYLNASEWGALYDAGIAQAPSKVALIDYWVNHASERSDTEHGQASANIVVAIAQAKGVAGLQRGDQVTLG
jgi:hypothetical protein